MFQAKQILGDEPPTTSGREGDEVGVLIGLHVAKAHGEFVHGAEKNIPRELAHAVREHLHGPESDSRILEARRCDPHRGHKFQRRRYGSWCPNGRSPLGCPLAASPSLLVDQILIPDHVIRVLASHKHV